MKSLSRRSDAPGPFTPHTAAEGPTPEELAELDDLEALITKSPLHAQALSIQATLRLANSLEAIEDMTREALEGYGLIKKQDP